MVPDLVTWLVTFGRTPARKTSGAKGIRTPDLLHAMQTRYQLRHSPATCKTPVPGCPLGGTWIAYRVREHVSYSIAPPPPRRFADGYPEPREHPAQPAPRHSRRQAQGQSGRPEVPGHPG